MRYGAEALDGFGLNSAIYFGLSGPIDPATLPSAEASMAPEAHLQLVNVTAGSPFRGSRMPLAGCQVQRSSWPGFLACGVVV